jgi:hypothetical protein
MIASVAIEAASFGPTAAAGWLAEAGSDPAAIGALDAAGGVMFLLVFVALSCENRTSERRRHASRKTTDVRSSASEQSPVRRKQKT